MGLEVDILIQLHVWPEVYKLYYLVPGTEAIYTAKALDNANRIPVNIVTDNAITVLKVLAFRDAVSCNKNIDFVR
jgi:hypothetical protein